MLHLIERGVGCSHAEWMGRVGVAVKELDQVLGPGHERIVDRCRGDHATERYRRIVDGFGKSDQIRLDIKEFVRERGAEATEARDDFVEDQQDAMLGADLAQSLEIALGRHDHAGRALHGFDDDRRDVAGVVQRDDALELVGQMQAPLGLTPRITHLRRLERVGQVIDARNHQWREHFAVGRDATHRDTTHTDAVISALATDDARARAVATSAMIGHGDFEGGVDRLGPRIDEENFVVRTAGELGDTARERKSCRVPHLEARTEVERGDLSLHGLDHALG